MSGARCWWCGEDPLYVAYHDHEWGFPVADDRRLFEKLVLEGFQSGLSWLTILRKRENFRAAFAGFDFAAVAEIRSRILQARPVSPASQRRVSRRPLPTDLVKSRCPAARVRVSRTRTTTRSPSNLPTSRIPNR